MARVLVGCEFSGIVRNAFEAYGHDAWSCDLLDTETVGNHIRGDILDHIEGDWDLVILHPPCTYLAVSGARWWKDRLEEQKLSIEFVKCLMSTRVPRWALENPIGILSSAIRKPDQIIEPWMFGHRETKATCLWLNNLPLLRPTDVQRPPWDTRVHKMPPSKDRWMNRSRTYFGIAMAMAEQWGSVL